MLLPEAHLLFDRNQYEFHTIHVTEDNYGKWVRRSPETRGMRTPPVERRPTGGPSRRRRTRGGADGVTTTPADTNHSPRQSPSVTSAAANGSVASGAPLSGFGATKLRYRTDGGDVASPGEVSDCRTRREQTANFFCSRSDENAELDYADALVIKYKDKGRC